MRTNQIFIEKANDEEFERIKDVLLETIKLIKKDEVDDIIFFNDIESSNLNAALKQVWSKQMLKEGFVTQEVYDMNHVTGAESEEYKEYMKNLDIIYNEAIKKAIVVTVTTDTNYKSLSVLNTGMIRSLRLEMTDDELVIMFSNFAKKCENWNMTIHIETEDDVKKEMMFNTDVHYDMVTKELSYTRLRIGSPALQVYVGSKTVKVGSEEKEMKYFTFMVPYGDKAAMYSDILIQLSELRPFDRLMVGITTGTHEKISPIEIEDCSLLKLKNTVFELFKQMNWFEQEV